MAKTNLFTTIEIDDEAKAFHFYSKLGEGEGDIHHHIENFSGELFSDDFFEKFKSALQKHVADNPCEGIRRVTVVIPDCATVTDAVKVPTIKGIGKTAKSLDASLRALYKNYTDLRIITKPAAQNKQFATYSVAATQKTVISKIYAACSENKMLVDTLTFASNAELCGAVSLMPKLKGTPYLFLDMRDTYTRFIFATDSRVLGFFRLPFGFKYLRKPRLIREELLFDHSFAELAVINAKERAKGEKLTIMQSDAEALGDFAIYEKVFVPKEPRAIPAEDQRPVPDTDRGIICENFRVFVKWALDLIDANTKLTEIAKPQFICVNMPADHAFVLEEANRESEENGIEFILFESKADTLITANLELYGGFFPKNINPAGKF